MNATYHNIDRIRFKNQWQSQLKKRLPGHNAIKEYYTQNSAFNQYTTFRSRETCRIKFYLYSENINNLIREIFCTGNWFPVYCNRYWQTGCEPACIGQPLAF